MKYFKHIILGAGLTGLSAAYSIRKQYLLVEKNNYVGGLTSTEKIKNYYFDHTGHWLHLNTLKGEKFVKKILKKQILKIKRKSKILFNDKIGNYPYQYNLFDYGEDFATKSIVSLFKIKKKKSTNFKEFCYQNFGKMISDNFLLPYNLKLWGKEANTITSEWCKKFFPKPDIKKIILGAFTKNDFKGYNHIFYYPSYGGIGTLSNKIKKYLDEKNILLNSQIKYIDPILKVIKINNEIYRYKHLISTIPLPSIINYLIKKPLKVKNFNKKLKCTKLRYINYGIKRKALDAIHWLYIADKKIPFYRIGCSSNAVKNLAPKNSSSVFLEVSNNTSFSNKKILIEGRKFLLKNKIIHSVKDLEVEELKELDFGYVIFDKNYNVAREFLLNFLSKNNIHSVGRYGSWIYSSMEDAILSGLNIKNKIDD